MIASGCELLLEAPAKSEAELLELHPPDLVIPIPPEVVSLPYAVERVREYLAARGISPRDVRLPCQWWEIGTALGLHPRVVERKIEELRNELSTWKAGSSSRRRGARGGTEHGAGLPAPGSTEEV